MSDSASRYRAICEIADHCTCSLEVDTVLRRILVSAQAVLPSASLGLLLADGVNPVYIGSEPPSYADDGILTAYDGAAHGNLAVRALACETAGFVTTGAPSDGGLWAFPFNRRSTAKGVLLCGHADLSDDDKAFLDTVARYLSLYLSCERNRRGLAGIQDPAQKRIQEVSAIHEISQALDSVPIEDLLKLITEKAAIVMDAQACSLMLKHPGKDELVIKASFGLSDEIVEETHVAFGEGVAGRVAKTGKPMLLTNLQDDPRFVDTDVVPKPDIVSSICVPLRDEEGRVHGVLSIRRKSPAAMFNEDDVKLFSVFASQAAIAISNAHLYASLKERVQELSALYEAGRLLSGMYSLDSAANALVRVAVQMIGDISTIVVLLDKPKMGSIQAASKISRRLQKALENSIDKGAVAWMRGLREARTFALHGHSRAPKPIKGVLDVLEGAFAKASLVPLVSEDSVIGILVLGDKTGQRLDQRRIRLLSIVTHQAAMVMKNAWQYEEEMGQRALELSALYELSERVSTARTLGEALDSILDIVRDIVHYDESSICTVDYERSVLIMQACRGMEGNRLRCAETSLCENNLCNRAIHERKAFISPDISKDKRFRLPSVQGAVVRSFMAIPLIVHDEVVGVLSVHSYTPNLYTDDNVKILSVIASQAAALYKELEALSALTNYTDNILRSIAAGVITLDRDGKVLTWNQAAADAIDIPAGEAVNQHFSDVIDRIGITDADKQRILGAITRVLETGEKYLGYKQEYHPVDGDVLYVNMNITQLCDHNRETLGLVIIFEDVTKQVQMEQEMRRIAELAAIGQLAASIAHELRNPLSSIKGAAQYLRNEYADHTAVREFLDIIIDEVNGLNRITTEFLDFARPTRLNLRETDINDVLFRTLQFMQLDITKQDVRIEQDMAYSISKILADDKQLEQVFRNMILNALQAMPDGGRLAVKSETTHGGVKVTLADSGIGIPEEKLEQIFVPFFTTKTKGTGLGLAIVRKIVENHGGRISVKSTVGQGTTFDIYFPTCSDKARAAMIQAESEFGGGGIDLLGRVQA